jgi:hypothetical protein
MEKRSARVSYRIPSYRTSFSKDDLKDVKALNKNVASISLEFHFNEVRAAREGRIYYIPPAVIDTRHAASLSLESWLLTHAENVGETRMSRFKGTLEAIRQTSPEFPIITNPENGEDDATENIGSWVDLTQIYRFCIQESRFMRDGGDEDTVELDFVVYPPGILLHVEEAE